MQTIQLCRFFLYIKYQGLHLCIHFIKCKYVPTLKFGEKKLNLSIFLNCTLYKYNSIPFLSVIYIRIDNAPIILLLYQTCRKVYLIFPNGKSLGYSRPIGRFLENKRFSEGDFDDNSLNIGQLGMFFTFVFWFNLEKMP